jgi:hypothetical protein
VAEVCERQLAKNHVSKTAVANYLGITPQSAWQQFKEKRITADMLIAVVTLTDMDADEVKKLLTIEGKVRKAGHFCVMPKAKNFTQGQKIDHQGERVAEACERQLAKNHVSKTAVANYLGISPSTVCQQFKRKRITADTLLAVVTMTDMDADEVKKMLTIER